MVAALTQRDLPDPEEGREFPDEFDLKRHPRPVADMVQVELHPQIWPQKTQVAQVFHRQDKGVEAAMGCDLQRTTAVRGSAAEGDRRIRAAGRAARDLRVGVREISRPAFQTIRLEVAAGDHIETGNSRRELDQDLQETEGLRVSKARLQGDEVAPAHQRRRGFGSNDDVFAAGRVARLVVGDDVVRRVAFDVLAEAYVEVDVGLSRGGGELELQANRVVWNVDEVAGFAVKQLGSHHLGDDNRHETFRENQRLRKRGLGSQ